MKFHNISSKMCEFFKHFFLFLEMILFTRYYLADKHCKFDDTVEHYNAKRTYKTVPVEAQMNTPLNIPCKYRNTHMCKYIYTGRKARISTQIQIQS